MPVIFYTKDEVDTMKRELEKKAMTLAQALCTATEYPCIREPNDAGPNGPGEYCDGCPAEKECPHQFKQWSK